MEIVPCEYRSSVIVGTVSVLLTVPRVRIDGPILENSPYLKSGPHGAWPNTHPRIPSTPLNPVAVVATPMLAFVTVRPAPKVTVSVSKHRLGRHKITGRDLHSVPLNDPEPYETLIVFPVLTLVEVTT